MSGKQSHFWGSLIVVSGLIFISACGSSGGSNFGDTDDSNSGGSTNTAPVASAGTDASVNIGTLVTLDGTASSDADGDTLSYSWQLTSQPQDSSATLTNANQANPQITVDVVGDYVVELTVNDGTASDSDSVTITATDPNTNVAPVADAGENQSVAVGTVVDLDGSGSSDANGDALSYLWTITDSPDSSSATLNDNTSTAPSLTLDVVGDYSVSLVVNDGELDSAIDTVTITASNSNVDITDVEFGNRSGDCLSYIGSYFSNVTDIQRSMAFSGDITITDDGTKCTISANSIPNHDFNDQSAAFATNVSEIDKFYTFTKTPAFASQATDLTLGQSNAIMLNGVVLDMLAAACYGVGDEPLGQERIGCGPDQIDNPWRYDPMSPLNGFGTDIHNAHVQPDGSYHYHGNPMAMFALDCDDQTDASPVIGFAPDGYPVYGSCIQDPDTGDIREATPSYVLKDNGGPRQDEVGYDTPQSGVGVIASANYDGQFRGDYEYQNGAGDLDECNGMTVDGEYGYYVTNAFPWVMNCFKGTPDDSFSAGGPAAMAVKMHSHDGKNSHSH